MKRGVGGCGEEVNILYVGVVIQGVVDGKGQSMGDDVAHTGLFDEGNGGEDEGGNFCGGGAWNHM